MVTSDLIVVDGPNLYNRVAEVIARLPSAVKAPSVGAYFSDWFDFDRLLYAALKPEEEAWPPAQGIHLVHSERPLGRQESRQQVTRSFWTRQARWPGCRDRNVHFPIEDVEQLEFVCACGRSNKEKVTREKGVDATVITIFYESLPKWESAVLAANDTDFAPVIESLHRLGKTISIVGRRSEQGAALERLGHNFLEISARWLERDLEAFRCLRSGGELDQLFAALNHSGFDAGTRIVPKFERRPAFNLGHDFEIISGREDAQKNDVEELIANHIQRAWVRPGTRHRMTDLKVFLAQGITPVIERYCTEARWMHEASTQFPARFLAPEGA